MSARKIRNDPRPAQGDFEVTHYLLKFMELFVLSAGLLLVLVWFYWIAASFQNGPTSYGLWALLGTCIAILAIMAAVLP